MGIRIAPPWRQRFSESFRACESSEFDKESYEAGEMFSKKNQWDDFFDSGRLLFSGLAIRCAEKGMKVVLPDIEEDTLVQVEAELRQNG